MTVVRASMAMIGRRRREKKEENRVSNGSFEMEAQSGSKGLGAH